MNAERNIVAAPAHRAYRMVLHHNLTEDFSVYRPAGLILRWYALTLDSTLSGPLTALVQLPFTRYLERLSAYGMTGRHYLLQAILIILPLSLYFVAPTLLFGQTLGKRIVGLRVINSDGTGELTLTSVIMRELVGKALAVATLGIGLVWIAFDRRKRGLHDHFSRTSVVAFRD